ncbi:hypothetical protein [Sulfurimonas sp.]
MTDTAKKEYILKNTMLVLSKTDGFWNSLLGIQYYHKAVYDLYLLLFVDIFLAAWFFAFWPFFSKDFATYALIAIFIVNLIWYLTIVVIRYKKAKIIKYGEELYGNKYNIYEIYQLVLIEKK